MSSSQKLVIYSTRHREFTQLLADGFTKESGVEVEIVDIKADASMRMLDEGAACPADIVVTLDYRRLIALAQRGLTQAVRSDVLETLIPDHLRDPSGHWFAQSMRARLIFADRSLDRENFTYDDLADPRWHGKLIIRSPDHMFNTALIAAYLTQNGEARTEAWLQGIQANRPLRQGGDRNVARWIADGHAEIGLCNSYYYGEMHAGIGGPDQQDWIQHVRAFLPTFDNGRTPVNITGAAVARNAPNRPSAIAFLEFLASDDGQRIYADIGYEYPASPHVAPNPIINDAGPLLPDRTPFSAIAQMEGKVVDYIARIPWN